MLNYYVANNTTKMYVTFLFFFVIHLIELKDYLLAYLLT